MSCRSKGIAACRTTEAAPGMQFFHSRSENGCARRRRADGSQRWTLGQREDGNMYGLPRVGEHDEPPTYR